MLSINYMKTKLSNNSLIFVVLFFSVFCLSNFKLSTFAYIKNQENSINFYTLGNGDKLKMRLYKVEGFDTLFNIQPDGTANLPRLGSVYLQGLTVNEASQKITHLYKKILVSPVVYLDVVATRPIRVNI